MFTSGLVFYQKNNYKNCILFSHPDYTVGFGISPNHAFWLVGCTTGGELHPALKIMKLCYSPIVQQKCLMCKYYLIFC